jgi:hypothetical protein
MAPLTEEHNASIADFVPELDRLAANVMADWKVQAQLSPWCRTAR